MSQKNQKTKMLYEPSQTKKYILIGAAALVVLALVFWGAQKMKPKPADAPPIGIQKTNEEIQKKGLESLTASEKSRGNQGEQEYPDSLKAAKESLTVPESTSSTSNQPSPVSPDVLDSLNAE